MRAKLIAVFLLALAITLIEQASSVSAVGPVTDWPWIGTRQITQGYHPWESGRYAYGLDFSLRHENVYAAGPGTVYSTYTRASDSGYKGNKENDGWGNEVIIQHPDGYYTRYAHLSSVLVSEGQVALGTLIAISGNSGNSSAEHLHFEVYRFGFGRSNSVEPGPISGSNNPITYPGPYTNDGFDGPPPPPPSSCSGPSLTGPANGYVSTSQTVSFSWNPPGGCTFSGYTFRIKNVPTMDSGGTKIVDTGEPNTQRTQTITGWDNTDLYWGVRTANPLSPNWSVGRFRIAPNNPPPPPPTGPTNTPVPPRPSEPGPPTLISPPNGYSTPANQTINFSWFNTRASQYKFEAWNDTGQGSVSVLVDSTSYSFAPDNAGSWRWQVRSVLSNGQPGDAPPARSFTVSSAPPQVTPTTPPRANPGVPTLLNPLDGYSLQVNQTINFSWSDTGASQYKLEVWNDTTSDPNSFMVAATSYSFTPRSTGSWRWQVRSILNNGQPGDAPWARNFTVNAAPVTPTPIRVTPTPLPPNPVISLDFSPSSAAVADSVTVHAKASDSTYNTIRVTFDCGSPGRYENGASEVRFPWNTDSCSAGTHTVTAEARTSDDPSWSRAISASKSYSLSPRVYSRPSVDFVAESSTSGAAPLTVRFADRNASAGITDWLWNFGDGTTSTQSGGVNHTYNNPGTYSVSLTVSGPGGSYTATKPNMVTVSPSLPAGLVGSWNFDEGSGSTSADLSGKGNTAQLISAQWTTGIRGSAVRFSGERSAGVKVIASSSLQSNTFTFAACVRPSASPEVIAIATQGASNNANERWALNQHSDRLELVVWSSGGSSSVQSDGGMLAVGQWSCIAVSFDGLDVKFYRDGALRSTRTLPIGGINSGVYDLYLGSTFGNVWGQESFRGDIDEVRYYNSVVIP